jgi:hypothetical protein
MLTTVLLEKIKNIYIGYFAGKLPAKRRAIARVFSRTDFLGWQTAGNAHTLKNRTTFVSR